MDQLFNRPIPSRGRQISSAAVWLMFCSLGSLMLVGCDPPIPGPGGGGGGDGDDGDVTPPTARVSDCQGCHTNEEMLKLVARDEPPPVADTGEG